VSRRKTDLRYEDGRTASYEDIRRHILRRDPACRLCGAPATEVDHIWPRFYGGDDTAANLQGLCSACNKRKGNLVSVDSASVDQLAAAIAAITERLVALVDDLDRFGAELLQRGMGWRRPDDQWMALAAIEEGWGATDDVRHTLAGIVATLDEGRRTALFRLLGEEAAEGVLA